MKILVWNGSPRPKGHTAKMVEEFAKGACQKGHDVHVVPICSKRIGGCLACEGCHVQKSRICVQKDDMQSIYPLLDEADMLVLASPVYYHSFSAQLQCAIQRIYALDHPKALKKAALLLSSGSPNVYGGAEYIYQHSFLEYLRLEDQGRILFAEKEKNFDQVLQQCFELGVKV